MNIAAVNTIQLLPGVLRPEARERIAWHQSQGDTIAVVSGALEIALSPWCASHDLDLIGSRFEHRDGILTGRHLGRQCVHLEKARRARERYDLARYDAIHAYGDTKDDLAMLALADHRWYQWRKQPSRERRPSPDAA